MGNAWCGGEHRVDEQGARRTTRACCVAAEGSPADEETGRVASDNEEEIGQRDLRSASQVDRKATSSTAVPTSGIGTYREDTSQRPLKDDPSETSCPETPHEVHWPTVRPVIMCFVMVTVTVIASFAEDWLDKRAEDKKALDGRSGGASVDSFLRYGTIPIIAAIIGYGTNVLALWMMFYPVKFFGYFPDLRIGMGLDLPLFGWQGVIPMKCRAMAEISVDLMTSRLINVTEVFARLEPSRVAEEVSDVLPKIVSEVVQDAGRKHCPKLWEYLPLSVRKQLEEQVVRESKPMMANFIADLQNNIATCFDLKHCVVEKMVSEPEILIDMFQTCGKEEFEFIRVSGFYLGFAFGLVQMVVWMFVREWWILPVCGVFVGYFTNVIALKVIFWPIQPWSMCFGLYHMQGLFLKRQAAVSALYGKKVADQILCAPVLMHALANGPSCGAMYDLVDKHVEKCMEDQATYYKPMFLVAIGAETWADFRKGVCDEFRKRLPELLEKIEPYTQQTLELEGTLRTRLEGLPAPDFERLLHAVFEQDEIKLILVGAILGAIVGFLQAVCQTPEQLGISF